MERAPLLLNHRGPSHFRNQSKSRPLLKFDLGVAFFLTATKKSIRPFFEIRSPSRFCEISATFRERRLFFFLPLLISPLFKKKRRATSKTAVFFFWATEKSEKIHFCDFANSKHVSEKRGRSRCGLACPFFPLSLLSQHFSGLLSKKVSLLGCPVGLSDSATHDDERSLLPELMRPFGLLVPHSVQ